MTEETSRGVLHIERISDSHDCETCGYSGAEGARVTLNGEPLIELVPVAHCFGGDDFDDGQVFAAVLTALGFDVTTDEPWLMSRWEEAIKAGRG